VNENWGKSDSVLRQKHCTKNWGKSLVLGQAQWGNATLDEALDTKKRIVDEEFSIPKIVQPTAWTFSVQPTQIRIWKGKFAGCANCHQTILSETPEAESTLAKSYKEEGRSLRFAGGGRKCALHKDVIEKLQVFYEGKRFADLGVMLRLMTAECRHLDQSLC
jgi:hypothetical protein